jgi:YesN/AraC family two-component response regulator
MERSLLLVDDEENILRSLKRVFRRDGYKISIAVGGQEGLKKLEQEQFDVIISDQRMPGMSGTEFFSKVYELYPDTIRIVLSGYTDLKSITDAINEGAIYKFYTKPWDDKLLRLNIQEAFKQSELAKENTRLTTELQGANQKLSLANKELERHVEIKTRQQNVNLKVLQVSQLVLESFPLGILAVDESGMIVIANNAAHQMVGDNVPLVGASYKDSIPQSLIPLIESETTEKNTKLDTVVMNDKKYQAFICRYQDGSVGNGSVIALVEK